MTTIKELAGMDVLCSNKIETLIINNQTLERNMLRSALTSNNTFILFGSADPSFLFFLFIFYFYKLACWPFFSNESLIVIPCNGHCGSHLSAVIMCLPACIPTNLQTIEPY